MSTLRTYLDYNATAPLRPEARAAMLAAMDAVGNPSSVHAEGRRARAIVERAREQVAALAGARPSEVVFTSGATEAANTVLRRSWRTIHYSRVEHPAVVAPVLSSPGRLVELAIDGDGVIDGEALAAALARTGDGAGPVLVAAQFANNETGVLQPVAQIAALARDAGAAVLCDAVQAAGRVALGFDALALDYMLLSAHKIGGPKGVGALIVREASTLAPLIIGGGQESRKRAGTENVEAIAGFGAAAEAALSELGDGARVAALRDAIEAAVKEIRADAVILAGGAPRLANTSLIATPGVAAETLVIKLDLAGIAVSAGSACASGKVGQSPVLAAMRVAPEIARAAIRVSLGRGTTTADAERFIDAWRNAVAPAPGDAHLRGAEGACASATSATTRQFSAAPVAASMGE